MILPPDCDSIEFFHQSTDLNINGRKFTFGDRAVSFDGTRAFANPVDLEIKGGSTHDSDDRVLTLCSRIRRLTYHFSVFHSSDYLPQIFRRVLAKTDVSDILITRRGPRGGNFPYYALFEEINKYRNRSFSVAMRHIMPENELQLMLRDVSRNYTITSGSFQGGLETRVQIPAIMNVLPSTDAETCSKVS